MKGKAMAMESSFIGIVMTCSVVTYNVVKV
jgi:hypothetical protein